MERSTNTYKIGVLGTDNKKVVFEHVVDGLTVIKCTNLFSFRKSLWVYLQ